MERVVTDLDQDASRAHSGIAKNSKTQPKAKPRGRNLSPCGSARQGGFLAKSSIHTPPTAKGERRGGGPLILLLINVG